MEYLVASSSEDCNTPLIAIFKVSQEKKNIIGDTSQKIFLHFKMISIYISYELIHLCSRPPRTPTPQTSLLSFLKVASDLPTVRKWILKCWKKRLASGDSSLQYLNETLKIWCLGEIWSYRMCLIFLWVQVGRRYQFIAGRLGFGM